MGVLDIPRLVASARARLREVADGRRATLLLRFFKTGPGQYGEGDRFLGIRVPDLRNVGRQFRSMSLADIRALLASKWHEERLLALVILVHQFERGNDSERTAIYRLYLDSSGRINNWDLVDVSAPQIVGGYLLDRDRAVLFRLAKSKSVWERRIAVLATAQFIRASQLDDTFAIVEQLLGDEHDLIHKACGWMLREAGKRDRRALERFLRKHAHAMPRTMLRYAIERLPPAERRRYLAA